MNNYLTSPCTSVILPVHNGERYIIEALESVLDQDTCSSSEIIVVDDNSTDSTPEIVNSYGSKVRYIRLPECYGPGYARNIAIANSRGSYLGFIDHDDMWSSHKLSVQLEYLEQNTSIDFVISKMTTIVSPDMKWPKSLNQEYHLSDPVSLFLGTMLIRKEAFMKVGFFNSNLHMAEDVDWFSRASDAGLSRAEINEVLHTRRIHESNLSLNNSKNKKYLFDAIRQSVLRKHAKDQNE
jgi:glycosyltransferase involved in cell wall biosynthesis